MAVENDPRVGTIIGAKWRVDALLGSGSMASVYAVTHRNGSRAALKILHDSLANDVSVCERFLGEGYLTNTIKHAGIVRVFDDGMTDDGAPFLAMDLLEGVTLEERRTQAGGKLAMFDVLDIADRVMGTLNAVHTAGIIHRDLKPQNVFCEADGGIRLLDFGVARLQERVTQHSVVGMVLGTPSFMSPEQALGGKDVDARSDIWALGAIMFTLLSGETVHVAGNVQARLLAAASVRARSIKTLMPQLPADVILVIDTALQFKKDDRWQTVAAMKNALANVKQSLPPPNLVDAAIDSIRQPSIRPNPPPSMVPNLPNAPPRQSSGPPPTGANPSSVITSAPPVSQVVQPKGPPQAPPRHHATAMGVGPAGLQADVAAARSRIAARAYGPAGAAAEKPAEQGPPQTQRGVGSRTSSDPPPTPMMQGAPQLPQQPAPPPPPPQQRPPAPSQPSPSQPNFDPHRAPYESLLPANESSSLPALGNTYPAWAPTPQEDTQAADRRRQLKIILSVVAMFVAAGVAFVAVAFIKAGNANNGHPHGLQSATAPGQNSAGNPAGSSTSTSDNELWKQPPPVPYWLRDGGAGRMVPQPMQPQLVQPLPPHANGSRDAGANGNHAGAASGAASGETATTAPGPGPGPGPGTVDAGTGIELW